MPSSPSAAALVVVAAVAASCADGRTIFPKPTSQVDDPAGVAVPINTVDFQFRTASGSPTNDILTNAFERYYAIAVGQAAAVTAQGDVESLLVNAATPITALEVTLGSADTSLTLETNVSYTLKVAAPTITIQADNVFGALNGLESFSQLVEADGTIVGTTIFDNPRYQFRATMCVGRVRAGGRACVHGVLCVGG
jgi:hypothetical protein